MSQSDLPYTPTPEEEALLAAYNRDRDPVPFSQLAYTRPDLDEMKQQMKEHVRGIKRSKTLSEALEHLKGARSVLYLFDTMDVLSQIYYDIGVEDDYWYEEMQFCVESYDTYTDLWINVYWAADRSRFREQLLPLWSPTYNESYEGSSDYSRSDVLLDEIDDIVDEAVDIIEYAEVDYEGQMITLYDAYYHEDWVEACEAWFSAYGERLLSLYTQMVATGSEMARDYYGYDSYAAYLFDSYDRDYTPEMAYALVEDLLDELLVLSDLMDEADWEHTGGDYPLADFLDTADGVLASMDEEMVRALDLMRDYELFFTDEVDYGYARPYVIHLATPNVPFLFCPYYDDLESAFNFTHEFGHFYEIYVTMDDNSFNDDLSEVHSQAMSLLFAQRYQDLYGDRELMEYALSSTVSTLVYQAYAASIELIIYDLPPERMTVDAIRKIGYDQSLLYGHGEEYELFAMYQWLTDTEVFTDPLQPFCYATSACVALDLWKCSLDDADLALETYNMLVYHPQDARFLSQVTRAGMASPFADGWSEEMAAFIKSYLPAGAYMGAA